MILERAYKRHTGIPEMMVHLILIHLIAGGGDLHALWRVLRGGHLSEKKEEYKWRQDWHKNPDYPDQFSSWMIKKVGNIISTVQVKAITRCTSIQNMS